MKTRTIVPGSPGNQCTGRLPIPGLPENVFPETKQVFVGEMGELKAKELFCQFGATRFWDRTKKHYCIDYEMEYMGKIYRIQVKTTVTGQFVVMMGRSDDKGYTDYTEDMVDVMVLVYYDQCWVIPIQVFRQRVELGTKSLYIKKVKELFPEYQNNFSMNDCKPFRGGDSEITPDESNLLALFGGTNASKKT